MRELVIANRISGMAYEPAWLAGQIATVYLPWLFAALLTRMHVTRFKWLEVALLGFAGLLLLDNAFARRIVHIWHGFVVDFSFGRQG